MRRFMIARRRASLAGALLVTLSLILLWDRYASPIAAQGPPACVAPPSGMVSWWPGDGSSVDFRDSNPGTLVNGATFAPGKVGLGFSLDGVDDRIEIPDAANLKPANVTVDAWVRFDALDTPGASGPGLQYIVFKRNSRTSFFEGYALTKIRFGEVDRFNFVISSASGVQVAAGSTTAVSVGQFYHIAGSYDGTTAKLYVNGVLEDQRTAGFPLDYGTRPVFIGSTEEAHNGRLKGVVDEASIYNRALSAAEILAIFDAGSAGKCKPSCLTPASGLVSWWPGDGQAVDVQDGNHGTLINGATFAQGVTGQSFSFDGIDDSLSTNLDTQPGAMPSTTWEAWVLPTRVNHPPRQQIFSNDDGGFDRSVLIEGNTANFGVFTGGGVWQPTSVTVNQWQHIAVVYTPTNIEFYKNGVRFSFGAAPSGQGTGNRFNIGRNPSFGEHYQGRIDEVGVYNRALSQGEIQAIFNAGGVGKCKPPGVHLDGKGGFLHASANDNPAPPAIVNLAAVGLAPGDNIRLSFTLQNFSFFSCNGPFATPAQTGVNAVFSTSSALLAPNVLNRVPGAIDTGPEYISPVTAFGSEPTDILQDFILSLTVQIPAGATHLFLGVVDSYYQDNCGKVIVTIERIGTDLEITQSVSPDPVTTGSDLTYQLLVKNNGPSAATSATVTDNLPPATTFVSCAATGGGVCGGSGNNRTVTFYSLALGASATVTLVAKVNCSVADGTMIGNTATVSSTTPDTNSSNNSTTTTVTAANPPPALTAPPAVSITADAAACGRVIDDGALGTATASDNCPGVTITRSGVPAGNFFPVSTTTITYTATDSGGNTATATQTVTVTDNTLPSITAPPTVTANTGAGATACGVVISDATLGTASASDNCGSAMITRSGVPAGNLFPIGTTIITYTATDIVGNVATATQTVTVTDNTAPTINAPPPVSVNTDAGSCAATSVNLGTPTTVDNCGVASVTNNAPSSFPLGTTTVMWTVTDVSGNTATATQIVTVVDNTAPTITFCPANISVEGNILGSCSANVNPGMATATDNCAGVSVAGVRSDGQGLNAPYPPGATTIIWTAMDAAGNTASCQQTVMVTNSAPVATITGPPTGSVYAVNTAVDFTGSFTDNAGGMHTAIWTFDAVTSAGTVNEATGAITGSHPFTAAGVYAVKLTVEDGCGGTHTTETIGPDGLAMLVVVYDPSAGWVTGGGWINSPAGAYVPDPTLTGKANFGFVSKYHDGASVPTGNTEFHFKAGNLKFQSTSYEWMVIAGARVQYKGAGKINGAGDYRFILTAIDGQEAGGGGQDKFRIRIWDDNGGGLVYDNQMNAPDSADPTTVLGGGSIVIHR